MPTTLTEQLERIKNRQTRYELVASHPDGRRLLVGYTARYSKHGILGMLRQNGPAVVAAFGLDGDAIMTFDRRGQTAHVGPWTITFSGRTQRDAYLGGELPFVAA